MGKKISKTDGANQAEIVAELSEKVMQHDGLLADIRKDVSEIKKQGGMAGERKSSDSVVPAESAEPKTYFLHLKAEDRKELVKNVSAMVDAKYGKLFKGLSDTIQETDGEVAKKANKSEIEKLRTELLGKIQKANNLHEQEHKQENERNAQKGSQHNPSKNSKSLLKEIWELLKDTVILLLRIIWLLLKFFWAILRATYKCANVIHNGLTNEKFWNWIYDHGTFLLSIIVFSALAWFMWYSYGSIFK